LKLETVAADTTSVRRPATYSSDQQFFG